MDNRIEPAGTDDADAVTRLWVDLAAGQRDHGSHILPKGNRTRIRESVVRHIVGETLLVARDSGVIGFVMFTVENGTYDQDTERGVVENLYVEPDHRGEGLGSALLTGAEESLADRDVDAVALEVMAGNERARQFYRREGYDPHRVELEKSLESDTHSSGGA